jgi:RNA polymerase sigma-70 factor (ECF subfamily)
LLTLVRQHDRYAWRRFVAIYGPMVYGWCRSSGLESADAGDVMQEVFANVFMAIETFRHDRPGDSLRGWLRVICRNKLHDHFRRRAASPQAQGGSEAAMRLAGFPEADVDEPTVRSERFALVRRAAELVREQFEARTWQAFWLVTVEQRSAADVAAQLGMTSGAVRQAKYMVLRKLREELRGELD